MLLVTDDYAALQRDWRELPAAVAPAVSTVREVHAGDTVTIFTIFTGCAAGGRSVCDATIDYEITRPDGRPYGDPNRGPLWTAPPPPGTNMQLGQSRVALFIELGDPLGTYTIRATVHDRVSGKTIRLEQKLEVKASPGAIKAQSEDGGRAKSRA